MRRRRDLDAGERCDVCEVVRGRNGQPPRRRLESGRRAGGAARARARPESPRALDSSFPKKEKSDSDKTAALDAYPNEMEIRIRVAARSAGCPAGGGTAAGPARQTAYDDAQTCPVTHKMPQRHQPVYMMTEREPRANRNPHRPTPQRASATRSRPRSGIRIRCAQTDTIALVAPARRAPRQHRRGHSPAHTFTQTHAQMQLYLRRWLVATCAARIACHRTNMFFTLYIHAL